LLVSADQRGGRAKGTAARRGRIRRAASGCLRGVSVRSPAGRMRA